MSININNTLLVALCEGLNNHKSKLQGLITDPANVLAAIKAARAGEWFPSISELEYAAEACSNCNIKFGRMPELKTMLATLKGWALSVVGAVTGTIKTIGRAIRARFTNAPERGALLALNWASSAETAPAVVLCWIARTSTKAQIDEILG